MEVAFIVLDSSPYSKYDVLDQSWFDGVVFLYERGFRVPSPDDGWTVCELVTNCRNSHQIARLLQRHHWIAYVGLAIIFYVALRMIYDGTLEVIAATA